MPCSVGLLAHRRSGTGAQPNGLLRVTMTDRYVPLVTAACGTWVARPMRMTVLPPGATALSSAEGEVRPRLPSLRGQEPEGLAAVATLGAQGPDTQQLSLMAQLRRSGLRSVRLTLKDKQQANNAFADTLPNY
jgi:hypothetical protein